VGYPGTSDVVAFRQYMKRCQLNTTLDFAPYGTESLEKVLRALDTQRRFVAFAQAVQGQTPAALQRAFSQFARNDGATPTPVPGTI
jgi:hypothetical protein